VARRLAHEIKNPLTPIQLSAERLQRKLAEKLPEADQDLLSRSTQTIIAQVNALKGMVDDFSLYSRSSKLTPTPISMNELIREVLVLYEAMPVVIDLSLDPAIPQMRGDAALLRQVIHNLVQNALDAMAGLPAPRLRISTGMQAGRVNFSVQDNGSGVKDDMLRRIFEPYVTTKPKGTGLGLAIVKKIVDEHGGMVSIANVPSGGARVEILLPIEGPPISPVANG
jgi:nitrogen fixation/metabolism regulation signal transduction histidine kinase